MADTIFVNGMRFIKPTPQTPEWIKGKISIKVDDLVDFLKKNQNENGWVNIDLRKSKERGELYFALNTFVPKKQEGII